LTIYKAGTSKIYHQFIIHDDSNKHIVDAANAGSGDRDENIVSFTGYSPHCQVEGSDADHNLHNNIQLEANLISSLVFTLPLVSSVTVSNRPSADIDATHVVFKDVPMLLNTIEFEFESRGNVDLFYRLFDHLQGKEDSMW